MRVLRPVNWVPLIAATTVVALTMTSIGVLVAARRFGHSGTAASGERLASPSPSASTGTVQLSVPSANVVWAFVDHDHLYRSTDEGSHWEERPLPKQPGVRPVISFVDDHEGWLLASGTPSTQCAEAQAAIWHTVDAGTTWTQFLVGGIQAAQCKDLVYFSDSTHGWVTAWDPNHQPTVYWSGDRGMIWKKFTLPDPPDFKTLPGGFSLRVEWIRSFGRTMYLEAYGSQGSGTPYPDVHDRQYIFTSTDFGVTWAWKQKVASRDMALVSETRWLEVVPPPLNMDESVNGGQQFHPFVSDLAVDPSAAGAQLVFADANVGYATGGTRVQRTLDGGSHWVAISPPVGEVVKPTPTPTQIPMPTDIQLSAPSANVVWAFVSGAFLFRSTDQGATWQQRPWAPYPGSGPDTTLTFVDDREGWVFYPEVPVDGCSHAGALWHTGDAGATWQGRAAATSLPNDPSGFAYDQCKNYMTFVDSMHGFIAGHDSLHRPIISRSADAGWTWAQSTLPDPPGFTTGSAHALRVVNIRKFGAALLAVAVNGIDTAYVFRSADLGATWTYLADVPEGELQVTLVTETRWLLIANDGQGKESTDAGRSWHAFLCDYRDAAGVASTFVFATAQVGYGTVRGGVQRTTDGGAHWVQIKTSWP